MYAAVNSTWGGSRIEISRDMGKTWKTSKNPAFPEGSDRTFYQTWHIEPGHPQTPNVVWAGTEPAALFKSEDRGETWSIVQSLDDQPTRAKWVPGFGGMGLHSIAIDAKDPKRMSVGISVGGVYTTTEGARPGRRTTRRPAATASVRTSSTASTSCWPIPRRADSGSCGYTRRSTGAIRMRRRGATARPACPRTSALRRRCIRATDGPPT